MQIQMLGTGNAFGKNFYNNNALVYAGDFTLLIDCGTTAPRALHELAKPLPHVDGIIITHQHSDHIGGLEELAFRYKFVHRQKVNLYIAEPLIEPLWEHSLKGGLANGEPDCNLHTYFNVIPLVEGKMHRVSEHLTLEILRTDHVPNKYSVSLILNQKLFYSADMTFDKALLERLYHDRGITHFLHECQLEGKGEVHTTLKELLTLPEYIQQHIQLMHYDDNMPDYIDKTGKMTFMEQHRIYHYD